MLGWSDVPNGEHLISRVESVKQGPDGLGVQQNALLETVRLR